MKTKYVVVQEKESLKIKYCNGYQWQTKTFTNEELSEIFEDASIMCKNTITYDNYEEYLPNYREVDNK